MAVVAIHKERTQRKPLSILFSSLSQIGTILAFALDSRWCFVLMRSSQPGRRGVVQRNRRET